MLRQRQLPAFTGVPTSLASGVVTTVTCKLQLNQRGHVYWLVFGNDGATNPGQGLGTLAAPGMIDKIRFILDGKVQREITAVELNAINAANNQPSLSTYSAKTSGTAGVAAFRTYLPIYFAEPWRKGFVTVGGVAVPEAELSAINLPASELESATIEVDLIGRTSAGANGILDGPVIGGFYEFDGLTQNTVGTIVKWKRKNFGVSASPAEITSLDRRSGNYQSLHMFTTSDHHYITSLLFTRSNEQIRQDITRQQNDASLIARNQNPTALDTTSNTTKDNTGLFNLVFDYDDPIRNLLDVSAVSELTLKPTYDSAPSGNQVIVAQIVGTRD